MIMHKYIIFRLCIHTAHDLIERIKINLIFLYFYKSFIEYPDKEFESSEFPSIRTDFSLNDIKTAVLRLNSVRLNLNIFNFNLLIQHDLKTILFKIKVAKHLRSKRFANGSLALNQPKLSFILNKENYMPYAYNVYQQKDSNRL